MIKLAQIFCQQPRNSVSPILLLPNAFHRLSIILLYSPTLYPSLIVKRLLGILSLTTCSNVSTSEMHRSNQEQAVPFHLVWPHPRIPLDLVVPTLRVQLPMELNSLISLLNPSLLVLQQQIQVPMVRILLSLNPPKSWLFQIQAHLPPPPRLQTTVIRLRPPRRPPQTQLFRLLHLPLLGISTFRMVLTLRSWIWNLANLTLALPAMLVCTSVRPPIQYDAKFLCFLSQIKPLTPASTTNLPNAIMENSS